MYDIIIIGMGISGITAGIYAKRSNQKVLLIDKGMPGGVLNNIDVISNYPGLIDIKGPDFAECLFKQIKSMDIPFVLEEVIELDLKGKEKKVITKKQEYYAKKVILAMGRKPKLLGLDNEKALLGHGISTCAMCDGAFFKDKTIAVVGTGNSALQESLYLSNIVNKIYLINRRDDFRGEALLVENIKNNPKIKIVYNANIKTLQEQDGQLESIVLDNGKRLQVSGLFIYIGFYPATEFVSKKILDEEGYIKVNEKFETSIKGVYAIGDCIKKDVYQLVTATSDGARVIYNME